MIKDSIIYKSPIGQVTHAMLVGLRNSEQHVPIQP